MASFGSIAGRAGFVLGLDKTELDRGLPQAERQFERATAGMAASATRAGDSIGGGRIGVGLIGRIGLIGVAVNTGIQAMDAFARGLDTTGSAAFTTEGRIKNLASALLSGDLVSGFEALRRQPKTLDDLGISAQEAAGRLKALEQIAFGTAEAARKNAEETEGVVEATRRYAEVAEEAGTGSQALAQQLLEQGRAWVELDKAMGAAFRSAIQFRGPQGQSILPGAAGLIGQPPGLPSFGVPIRTRSRGSVLGQELEEAQRGGNLQAQERVLAEQAAIARRRVDIVKAEGPLMERRRQEYQDALNALDAVQDRIAAEEERGRQERARKAADRQREAAEAAARALRERQATREQTLRNAYERALQTPGQGDDPRTFGILAAFLLERTRDQRLTGGERADFRGELIQLRGQRKKDIEEARDLALDETRDELAAQEQVLKNRVAAAELTKKNKRDDLKALRGLRDFYRRQQRDRDDVFTDIEQARFGGDRIAAQKRINDLLAGKVEESSFTIADIRRIQFEFLNRLQGVTNQFGGNITADGAQTATNTWRTSKLTEQLVTSVDRLTSGVSHPGARYARNELMEQYGGVGGV